MRQQRKTYACFIDIKKAYDTVWRDGLWAALWQRGVRGKTWRVLRAYYGHIQSRAHVNGQVSEWFDIETGVGGQASDSHPRSLVPPPRLHAELESPRSQFRPESSVLRVWALQVQLRPKVCLTRL